MVSILVLFILKLTFYFRSKIIMIINHMTPDPKTEDIMGK